MSRPPDGPWVDSWLSTPRFAVYLATTNGNRTKALELYEWNAAISAAFHHDLAHVEVGLRNAYDRALTQSGRRHWVFDAQRYFPPIWQRAANRAPYDANDTTRRLIAEAIREASAAPHAASGLPPSGKVIAELSFGFWRYLSVKRHDPTLWVPYLHKAFRSGTTRKTVDNPVQRLHKFRNRIAHHEPLLKANLPARYQDILTVAELISPELQAFIDSTSSCTSLITARP